MIGLRNKVSVVLHSGAGIALAMAVMNVATYGYTILAARELGPVAYSEFAAMMNLLLVISVASLGLQATAARRVAAEPEHVGQIEHEVRSLVWRVALALGAVLLLGAPLIDRALRLDNLGLACLAGLAAVPLTLVGGYAGILQGERRWLALGLVYLASGLPRLVVGTALLLASPSSFTAMAGVTIGTVVPALVGWWALRGGRERTTSGGLEASQHGARDILRETVHHSQALFAFFALSNVDVIVARTALPDHEAGLYAGGIIMAKMLMFLPQFVVVVAFPSMSDAGARARTLSLSLAAVASVGLVVTGGVAVLSPIALALIGGNAFAEIQGVLWAFALLGTLLALLQLLVYSVLARRGQRSALLLWAALIALVVGGVTTESVTGLLTWVVLVDAGLLVALIAISYLIVQREPVAEEPASPEVEVGAQPAQG